MMLWQEDREVGVRGKAEKAANSGGPCSPQVAELKIEFLSML